MKKEKINCLKSKRGDIPTLVLVIGVFLVCAVTILTLSISIISVNNEFEALQSMVSVNSVAEQVRFYENAGLDPTSMLDIKKGSDYYLLTSETKSKELLTFSGVDKEKRMFYVEYKIPIKSAASK